MNSPVWLALDSVDALNTEGLRVKDAFLSPQERVRLAAVSGVRHQAQFRAGRLLMRKLLARVHGGDPLTDWPLTAAVDAAPTFIGQAFAQSTEGPWCMSISHSGGYVACAVASGPVGVDIGQVGRRLPVEQMAREICNPQELERLSQREAEDRALYFLALWTLKEAAIKRDSGRFDAARRREMATSTGEDEHTTGKVTTRSAAWTWQSDELTMAVVVDSPVLVPRWALPPPPFMLRNALPWNVTTRVFQAQPGELPSSPHSATRQFAWSTPTVEGS